MKRIVISSCMLLILLTVNQIKAQDTKMKVKDDKTKMKDGDAKEKDKDNKTKIKDDNTKIKIKGQDGMNSMNGMNTAAYPYTAGYSSNFVMGNPAHAKMALDIWKDWDENMLDKHDFMADTIVTYMPDGTVTKGKDANMSMWKKYRAGITSSKSTVDAWLPLRSVDRKEDWVAIWGTETDTTPDGKVGTTQIHEVWRINKDGKVDLIRQYTAKMSPQQPQ